MTPTLQKAYEIVFNDMNNSGCGLLIGKYDAKNSNESFMHGIYTVMEWIAYRADEKLADEYSKTFLKNIIKNKKKALNKK